VRGTKSFVTDIQVQRVEEETIMLRSEENERGQKFGSCVQVIHVLRKWRRSSLSCSILRG